MGWLATSTLFAQQPEPAAPSPPPAGTPTTKTGRLSGKVLSKETGRPIPSARVSIVGTPGYVETDLDGRFRTPPVAVGRHSARAVMIGYSPVQIDSIDIMEGESAIVAFALSAQPIQLQEIEVVSSKPPSQASDAGLLAEQRNSAAASDGISAETMARTPDSDAGDAVKRVTGVSVVGDKYVVVRGMGERYNNTLLNGSELASPEPLKKVIPLDVFPASLLEAVVATKAATPDKPGDFAGGSVEVRTKEFPENFVAQFRMSGEYNNLATLKALPIAPRGGTDFLAFDNGRRAKPKDVPSFQDNVSNPARLERFAEQLRDVWTPSATRVAPNIGWGANVGGQIGSAAVPLGVVVSLNYGAKTQQTNDRQFAFVSNINNGTPDKQLLYNETQAVVDWGGIANLSTRLGASHKLAWKNFYSRSAEETIRGSHGFDIESNQDEVRDYQLTYVERSVLQSQVAGEHHLGFLFGSYLEWKGTYSHAVRDEPENHQARYARIGSQPLSLSANRPNYFWFFNLNDRTYSAQADWSLPLHIRSPGDLLVKLGGVYRNKDRHFDAEAFVFSPVVSPTPADFVTLPPEQAFAPENLGSNMTIQRLSGRALPYDADDDLTAVYGMLDVEPFRRLRIVGGLRVEDWRLNFFEGSRSAPLAAPVLRRNRDYLWSANLTLSLNNRMNLRGAAFRTVSRPDPRELSPDDFPPVGGECTSSGNPGLQRALILNGDLRWEWYPGAGELVAVSGFYKKFDDPIIDAVDAPSGTCRIRFTNGESATNYGAELEFRTRIGFLSHALRQFTAGANLTLVKSRIRLDPASFGTISNELKLQGQSPFLLNASLSYDRPEARFTATALYNLFGDRIARYGIFVGGVNPSKVPDAIERSRGTLDAKVQKGFGPWSLSLSGRNLTDAVERVTQETKVGPVSIARLRRGVSVSFGVGYDF